MSEFLSLYKKNFQKLFIGTISNMLLEVINKIMCIHCQWWEAGYHVNQFVI
jgi:hypothetical protein